MIRALQRKFVFAAMLAVTILLIALLGSVNIINTMIQYKETNSLLDLLISMETAPHIPQRVPPKDGEKKMFEPPNAENTRMSAVYFVTHTNQEGQVIYADVERIASMSEEDAAEMTEMARKNGRLGGYRYRSAITQNGEKTVWVFLNISGQIRAVVRLLGVSALIGMVSWLIMLMLILLLSGRAIRPIAANIERQKQFVTDAGHEIKTPLAIILANTDAMELHNGASKWSHNIREQVMRLNGLMQNLLTLSRLDEGRPVLATEMVSLSQIIEETVEMFRERMELKNLSVTSCAQPEVTIIANRELLMRLLSILLDNAVKYAPDGSLIEIELLHHDKRTQLIVVNECENIPKCPPEMLFDRFFRADKARTQQSGGYGIGLSAARSIAEAHDWSITAAYPDKHKIAFFVNM